MPRSILVLTVVLVLWAPSRGEAITLNDRGSGFIGYKAPKVGKDYYLVKREDGKCTIIAGTWGSPPDGSVGAPYASRSDADAGLKKSPDCKGGEADDLLSTKRHQKK